MNVTIEDQIDNFLTRFINCMSEDIWNRLNLDSILILVAPLLVIVYRVIKHLGIWDKLIGRDKALEGLKRLRSAAGYPVNWIYENEKDRLMFQALLFRVKKNTTEEKIKAVLADGYCPHLIATAGQPVRIEGIPEVWPQEAKFFYPDNQPVLMVFKVSDNQGKDKGEKVCTLGELIGWLDKEKDTLDFWIGVIFFGFLSLLVTCTRLFI